MAGLKDVTAIVGIGQTPFAGHLPEDERTLACRAVLAALDDAGITPGEVDALASYTMEETDEVELAKAVGFGDLTFFGKVGYGGGGARLVGNVVTGPDAPLGSVPPERIRIGARVRAVFSGGGLPQ